jgi:hypothetical protein
LLRAAVDFAPDQQRQYPLNQLAGLLAQQNRHDEAFELYRQAVLPPEGPSNQLSSTAVTLVDFSISQNKADQLAAAAKEAAEKHPAWKPCGDLLLAMLRQRQKDEAPMIALAEKFQSDPAYTASLRS